MPEVEYQTTDLFQKYSVLSVSKISKLFLASAYVILAFSLRKQGLKDCDGGILIQLLCFWTLSIVVFFI
jgi:hypothetical protein